MTVLKHRGKYIHIRIASFVALFVAVVCIGTANAEMSGTPSAGGLAHVEIESKIFLLDPLPMGAKGAVSAWWYFLHAPNIYLGKDTLEDNLRANAEKFCAGGKWRLLHQSLDVHDLDFSFACYDERATLLKSAAIAQGLQKISPR